MKYAAVLMVATLVLTGCNKDKIAQLEEQKGELQTENQRLVEEAQVKNQFIEEYTQTLNEVYDNLELIRKREGLHVEIAQDLEQEKNPALKNKMISNIASIDAHLKASKSKLAVLRKKISETEVQTGSLNEMVENLTKLIAEKETHIEQLRTQTEELSARVSEVEGVLQEKEAELQEKEKTLNTAYYIVGSEKELKEKGISEEKGGLLGLRKTKKLAAGFDNAHFTSTDILETATIPFAPEVKKVDIVSPHNPESYHIVKGEENQTVLEIINPEEFWKIKYLVVVAKS